MSVIISFAMFPIGKGTSVSPYVARLEQAIRNCGYPSMLTPMSTIVETETLPEALSVVQAAYDAIEPDSERVYINATIDVRKGQANRMEAKVKSVEKRLN